MIPSESLAAPRTRPFALLATCLLALALGVGSLACGGDETPAEPAMAPATPGADASSAKPEKRKMAAAPELDETGLEAEIGEHVKVPADFPKDVPLYPGARATATMAAAGEGTLVTFDIEDAPEKVYDFYQEKLASDGWQIASSASMGGQWMIRALKDARAAHISIAGEGTGSQVGVAVAKAE